MILFIEIHRFILRPFLIEYIGIFAPFYNLYFLKAGNAFFDLAYTSAYAQCLVRRKN